MGNDWYAGTKYHGGWDNYVEIYATTLVLPSRRGLGLGGGVLRGDR